MKKQTIKLNESQLRNMIKRVLMEMKGLEGDPDIYGRESLYGDGPLYADALQQSDGSEYDYTRQHDKEKENEYSWDLFDRKYNPYKSYGASKEAELDSMRYRDTTGRNHMSDIDWSQAQQNSPYHERVKNKWDKEWGDQKDIEKYEKMADSRPLHRKGSLNRNI